jgi:ferredoxin
MKSDLARKRTNKDGCNSKARSYLRLKKGNREKLKRMLQLDLKSCGECGGCVAVCPQGALELFSDGLLIKADQCTMCENCIIFCPVGALKDNTAQDENFFRGEGNISSQK